VNNFAEHEPSIRAGQNCSAITDCGEQIRLFRALGI
jgi:hypothetical protein